jgi:mannose-6-phosphate isomerase class I
MVLPQLSPGDALAEQARQLAAAHAQNQALIQEAQQASELAYRSKVHARLLGGR